MYKLTLISATLALAINSVAASTYLPYADLKQNCTMPNVKGSYCYLPKQLDAAGYQIKSCSVPGTFAMTFDDGPYNFTGIVLDVLKAHSIPATFNVIGYRANMFPDLVKRMINEGHQISCHTYFHPHLLGLTDAQVKFELTMWENYFIRNKILGPGNTIPNYFRAPFGALDSTSYTTVSGYGYQIIHWGMLSQDSDEQLTEEQLFQNYYQHFYDGSLVNQGNLKVIYQQHSETEFLSAQNLDRAITYLKSVLPHVKFVTVADCMGQQPPAYRQSPRGLVTDPTCANGILDSKDGVCCKADCTNCGGDGCGAAMGTSGLCCAGDIMAAGVTCDQGIAPCIMPNQTGKATKLRV